MEHWKKNVALFLSGQAVSLLGTMLVQYAIMWYVTLETRSGSMITLFTLAGLLPTFFVSPFGGVLADRFNRKALINGADGVIALASLGAALLFFAGVDALGLLFACAVVRALGQGVQSPAVNALLPQLVPAERLTRVNGLNGSIQSVVTIASPALGAALLSLAPLGVVFLIDVATAAVGIGLLYFGVKVPPRPHDETPAAGERRYLRDLREGFAYVSHHGLVLRLIVLYALCVLAFTPLSFLTPLQVTRDFGADVWRLSVIEIAWSAGMIAGGLVIGLWGNFRNKMTSIAVACALNGAGAVALGITENFWFYTAIMVASGITAPFWGAPFLALLQERVDPDYTGRVFGLFTMASTLVMPVGMLLLGPLSDVVPIDALLIGAGVLLLALAIPFLRDRMLRAAGRELPRKDG